MKKLGLFLLLLFMPVIVSATNDIYKINMRVYLNKDGSASVTEVWNVLGTDGTEWCKLLDNVDSDNIRNFKVDMDRIPLSKKIWNNYDSFEQKAGYYGTKYSKDGTYLCWGKSDYLNHIFKIEYEIKNYISLENGQQVLNRKLISGLSDAKLNDFSIIIASYELLNSGMRINSNAVSTFNNGIIEINSDNKDYKEVEVLIRFNSDIFNIKKEKASIPIKSEKGIFILEIVGMLLAYVIFICILFLIFCFVTKLIDKSLGKTKILKKEIKLQKYGYRFNKIIHKSKIPFYRDIPCNKDIFLANALVKTNDFLYYRDTNIIGAIILKWIKEDKITYKKVPLGLQDKDEYMLDLTGEPLFDNQLEIQLYQTMYEISRNGILAEDVFMEWYKKNYKGFLKLFKSISNDEIDTLKEQGHIKKNINPIICLHYYAMDDYLYEESKKLYGLDKYLKEFTRIDTKEVLDVKLLDEYLMFAYIFGIADMVLEKLKNFYPQEIVDYDKINRINELMHDMDKYVESLAEARNDIKHELSSSHDSSSTRGGGGSGSFGGGGGGSR